MLISLPPRLANDLAVVRAGDYLTIRPAKGDGLALKQQPLFENAELTD